MLLTFITLILLLEVIQSSFAFNSQWSQHQSVPLYSTTSDIVVPEAQEDLIDSDIDAITAVAGNAVQVLIKSDLKRMGGGDGGGSSGWTSWVDDPSAYALQSCINQIAIATPNSLSLAPSTTDDDNERLKHNELLAERDETISWLRWMKAAPSSVIVDLSDEFRDIASSLIYDRDLEMIESSREAFLERMSLNLIVLPSGKTLEKNIRTPPGSLAYGKLLYGGARRYRILPGKFQRKTGERTAFMTKENENIDGWLQYGGPERNYEAVDMGSCAVLELIILPSGLKAEPLGENEDLMNLSSIGWSARKMIKFWEPSEENGTTETEETEIDPTLTLQGQDRNDYFASSFADSVGGLQRQIEAIVRRVLDGRIYRSIDQDNEQLGSQNVMEAKELESLGLTPVRGLLLYGPPGCGKTALAREISKALKAREPKIVAAPELLDRWVGGSEKLIRGLFEDAESELAACNGDATKSSLHVIVIDEIDAVFRKRSNASDSASATRASAVNQILAKLDGVNAIPNCLLIGMTNRRELLDEALLRSGRLEVQIEIPLPDKEGRREILKIHFEGLRKRGKLSEPLCRAIDGPMMSSIIEGEDPKHFSFRSKIKAAFSPDNRIRDLASSSATGQFSGADLAGLVRCAGSIALSRTRKQGVGIDSLVVTLEDVIEALDEVKR